MIYTRASWWDYYIKQTWGGAYPLWVAHYGAKTPSIPMGWYNWTFWQYSADGNGQGAKYGMQSYPVDLNHYYGNINNFNGEFGLTIPVPPTPTPCFTELEVIVDTLNIRKGPSTSYAKVGELHKGDTAYVYDVAGSNAWVNIYPGEWVCVTLNSTVFMKPASSI